MGPASKVKAGCCCAVLPQLYMLAADAAVAAAVFSLEHLISYCNQKIVLVLVWGTSERLVPAKNNRTPSTSERFVANCGVGPSTRGQGDSASLVQRR